MRTYQAIDRCHVALVLLDAQDLLTEQDKRLVGQVLERGKGLVIVVNKWDLAPKEEKTGDVITKKLIEELPLAAHAPRVFISALSGRSLGKLPEMILKVEENRRRRIPTSELNRLVKEVLVFDRMPGDGKGHSLKVFYCTQRTARRRRRIFREQSRALIEELPAPSGEFTARYGGFLGSSDKNFPEKQKLTENR